MRRHHIATTFGGFVGCVALVGCSASSKQAAAPVTVTQTVTQTVTAAPPVQSVAASDAAGSAPVSSAAAALPDPCSLLTQAEAETLAGTKLQPSTEAGPAGAATLCQFVGDPSGPEAQVEIIVGDGAEKELDIDRDNLKHAFTSVPGIGDEADQEDDNIFIRKGTLWVDINLVLLNDPSQNVKPMQTAAMEVAGRMP